MSTTAPTGAFFSLGDLGLPISQSDYMAIWLATMQAAFPGYNPQTTNATSLPLEYVQAQVFAQWASDVAQLCSSGATELFLQYGVQMLGLPYEPGTPATTVVTVTAVDDAGYTLPAITQMTLTLGTVQVGFETSSVLTIPEGSTSGQVTIQALQSGSAFNGASTPVALVTPVNWVSDVTLAAAASSGVDQEDDDAYAQRLASTLQTLGLSTVTASAFATRALNFIPASGTDQQEVGRATALAGYSPATSTFTVSANSSATLTVTTPPSAGVTAAPGAALLGTDLPSSTFTATTANTSRTLSSVSSFTNLLVGDLISGTGIPSGTTIVALNPGSSQITMSNSATASGSSVTITDSTAIVNTSTATSIVMSTSATGTGSGIAALVAGTLGNERTVTVCVTDASGNALNSDTLAALTTYLESFREVNFIVNVVSPTYTPIYVTVQVVGSTGFSAATVQSNVQATLLNYLTPTNFNLPEGALQGWVNSQEVFLSKVSSVIQTTFGVDHVIAGSLEIGTTSGSVAASDLFLSGAFPLPTSTTATIPTTAISVTTT